MLIKRIVILILMMILPLLAVPRNAALAACDAQCQVVKGGVDTANGGAPTNASTLDDTVAAAINLLTIIVGVVSIVMIIVAGFRYITSGGNADRTKSAKNTLIYAIVGLVIVGLAQTIAHFVLYQSAHPGA